MDKLKNSETEELIRMVKNGENSDEAFSELHSRYEPLINSRVGAFFGSGVVVSEAKQEASIALHNAVSGTAGAARRSVGKKVAGSL